MARIVRVDQLDEIPQAGAAMTARGPVLAARCRDARWERC